jgi:phosphatidylglycerophosphatase A
MKFPRWCVMFFASGFGAGYSPFASGTVATAVAIPLYFLLLYPFREGWHLIIYAAIVAGLFCAGVMAATEAERALKEKDPHFVTIDEIVGYFVCLFLIPISWTTIILSFFVFRLFDVWKPWPVRKLESIGGGMGIMIDDVAAGIYTWIVLMAVSKIF